MKESTTKYAKETWTDTYEDYEYDELLRECYDKCRVAKEQDQKRHKWRCIHCQEVFLCKPGLNYHRHKVCPKVGYSLRQYPIVGEGQRIVVKDGQVFVKGELGKRKSHMVSIEEDGMTHTGDTQTHQPPVMTTPDISNVFSEEWVFWES